MGLVALLTDFGLRDAYGAIVKGAIAQVNPWLQIIDLTHQIPPQDVAAARFQLMNAYPYFPKGTVHVAIVDPGVGSHRRAIAVQLESGFLVSPDNGLVSGVLSQNRAIAAVELTNPHYWRVPSPSLTFHGRDIFATVAAHLASGVPLLSVGTAIEIESIVSLPIAQSVRVNHTIRGSIQAIDHFGNLITTILGSEVEGKVWSVKIAESVYRSNATYSDGEPGEILALVGSHGWVEIAANRDNAQVRLGMGWGSSVEVILREG
ncbi:MAG: SAM-dependent chlorinase/fluorinase [Leptolyngbyaceae cyanobacterium CSU_1_3]|nr:SAM-dependent chlorinase/fluorinase [Leptolyngbyaceae cyanobacterium CSU_1_3]